MRTIYTSLAICAAIVGSSFDAYAIAATLDSIQGTVQVNSGAGFHKVAKPAQVAPGASIMADPGASAQILYSDGCRIPVKPGSVAVVAPISPCAQGQAAGDNSFSTWLGIASFAAFGAGVGILAATTHQNNAPPSPASP
jgi:hypothetical protein